MEVSSIIKMVEDALYNWFLIIDIVVSEDDRALQDAPIQRCPGSSSEVSKSKTSRGYPRVILP